MTAMRTRLSAYVLSVFVALVVTGCFSSGRDFPVTPVKNIQNNVTTQKDVFRYFGEPVRKGLQNGYETWSYSYQYYELGQLRDSKELHIIFNQDRTVRSYSFSSR
jgi:hypothetical protein